jgi:hypothetical protein
MFSTISISVSSATESSKVLNIIKEKQAVFDIVFLGQLT